MHRNGHKSFTVTAVHYLVKKKREGVEYFAFLICFSLVKVLFVWEVFFFLCLYACVGGKRLLGIDSIFFFFRCLFLSFHILL